MRKHDYVTLSFVFSTLLLVVTPTLAADRDSDSDAIRKLIPKAAGLDIKALERITTATQPPSLNDFQNQPFTLVMLGLPITSETVADKKRQAEFQNVGTMPRPSKLTEALNKSSKFGYGTAIQPEFITHLTCDVDGDTAKGIVSFTADKVYRGNVHYAAKRSNGKWQIVQFSLPAWDVRTSLGKDGNWKITGEGMKPKK
ncbi:MAG: hypothetical protein HQ567_03250 [Candidatus Nealsonbacteria bacterium]|nr:hypothetical protein [Candidatus Nealsonbacteria bacterium]